MYFSVTPRRLGLLDRENSELFADLFGSALHHKDRNPVDVLKFAFAVFTFGELRGIGSGSEERNTQENDQ